jgi:transposase
MSNRHKHREVASVKYFAGLDVSLEETAICVVDDTGHIVKEVRGASEPDSLVQALQGLNLTLERIGMEACSLTAWLHDGLTEAGLPGNLHRDPPGQCGDEDDAKQDRPQRRPRSGPDHADRLVSRAPCEEPATSPMKLAAMARRMALNEMRSIENVVRAILREAGVKLGTPSRVGFADRVRELASGDATVMPLVELLLAILAVMLRELARLAKQVLDIVRNETVCRRLMSVPGVGPITALAIRATIDRPDRFRCSRQVGAHLGLTPARYQSGETDIQGKVSRCGDETGAHSPL